jgi:hypothetical protein
MSDGAVTAAVIGASATFAVGAITAGAAYLASKRDRRRNLYGEAVKVAVGWKEQLYRVRRRAEGAEREIINDFHRLQDSLAYHQAWIGSDSLYMKRSYDHLVTGVKARTESLITAAWDEPIRPSPGNARSEDSHPAINDLVDDFLSDVRSHLSPWPWRKVAVRWRNRKSARRGISG